MKNNLYTLSPHVHFADTLAQWILEKWGRDPLVLSRSILLLPSHRSALSMREAFLRVSQGKPLLLPRMFTLGDVEEDALLVSPLAALLPQKLPSESFAYERLFLLARLIQKHREQESGHKERMDHALKLATSLAELMDELEREEITLYHLANIVPDAYAAHWQTTVEFLKILSVHWPQIAQEQELISPGEYQATLLRALAAYWQQSPPNYPIIAAGTTGSIPSTADMLACIAKLPQGFIVLPGLDIQADDTYFDALDESHPQWGMNALLKRCGVLREDVQIMGLPANERVHLLSEVMRPAEISDAWGKLTFDKTKALQGMEGVNCANLHEEAMTIALMLREVVEKPEKTAALVTHNRALARRVASLMPRYGIEIDDSAGLPLKETPLLVFMRLCLDAAAESLAPLSLLSLLKHPLAHAQMERIHCLEAARELEKHALRGLRKSGGIEILRQSLLTRGVVSQHVYLLLDTLENVFQPLLVLFAQKETSLLTLLDAHITCAEALGHEDMWDTEAGEAFLEFVSELRSASHTATLHIEPESYPGIFEELLYGKVLRPRYGKHPRLKILSPIEARMQSFDRVILGGLNEGSWPPKSENDPWFSRPMRSALGLPSPERKTGLAAHDFFMLASGTHVILTRSAKEDGVPTQPSRWLVKLDMLSGGIPENTRYLDWARQMDLTGVAVPVLRPEAKPPLAARPKKMSVTKIETWLRDPYAIYASEILGLRALEELGRAPDASDFGNAVHKALEDFVAEIPDTLPANALSLLLQHGKNAFEQLFSATNMGLLWWPRFDRIAHWIIEQEDQRRLALTRVTTEIKGEVRYGDFLLHGRADRIEEKADGSIAIIDYKTGSLPKPKDIDNGLSNQLVLLALIALEGKGFHGHASALEYWQLQGGEEAGEIKPISPAKRDTLLAQAKEGLLQLIARYNNPDFPYRSTLVPLRGRRYTDYDHLARVKEWG